MEPDEMIFNSFYLLLKEKFKKKYELALSKCWNICIPCSAILQQITITDEFIDDHILKPLSQLPYHYVSTDPQNSRMYKFEEDCLRLVEENHESVQSQSSKIKIINIEKGYNKDFQMYNIIFIDRLLNEKYVGEKKSLMIGIKLNRTLTTFNEAVEFFNEISELGRCSLTKLQTDAQKMSLNHVQSSDELINILQEWIKHHWAFIIRSYTLDIQRDARFQKLLSTALEIFIMHYLHDQIYSLLIEALDQIDLNLNKKIDELIDVKVTSDQLGVKEALAITLPSAIVELANLDARQGPLEKLSCLKTTVDLIIAEIKGALADIATRVGSLEENDLVSVRKTIRVIPTEDLIPLLIYVIVKSRPKRLITDLHYIQNFLWSVSPHDGLSYTIVTYKSAISTLQKIDVDNLPLRSSKVKNELSINDVLNVVTNFKRETTPLDRQISELALMLEECTRTDAGINSIYQFK